MSPPPFVPSVLHATLAALQARLALVFPPDLFDQRILPPKITQAVWKELTRRTPVVGIGWDGLVPDKPPSRRLVGETAWSVFLVVRNAGGPSTQLVGDALGSGLFDLVNAGAAVLHGHSIPEIGPIFVTSADNVVSPDWDMEGLVVACLALRVGATLPTASDLVADTTEGILKTLSITWRFPNAPAADVTTVDVLHGSGTPALSEAGGPALGEAGTPGLVEA